MNKHIVEAGMNMIAQLVDELMPGAEKAKIRRRVRRMSAELVRLFEAIDAAKPEPGILDGLRRDDERARANAAGILALALEGGAARSQVIEAVRAHRLDRARLDQHFIHTLLHLAQGLSPSQDDIH